MNRMEIPALTGKTGLVLEEARGAYSARLQGHFGSVLNPSGAIDAVGSVDVLSFTSQPYGVFNIRLSDATNVYSGKPTGDTDPWFARIGGSGLKGFYLADLNGDWGAGQATASLAGQYLTTTESGNLTGKLTGLDDGDGTAPTWIGQALAMQEGQKLAFSSRFDTSASASGTDNTGGLFQAVKGAYYDGSYLRMTPTGDPNRPLANLEYEYLYFLREGATVPQGYQQERIERYEAGTIKTDRWSYGANGLFSRWWRSQDNPMLHAQLGMTKNLSTIPNLHGKDPYYDPASLNFPGVYSIVHGSSPQVFHTDEYVRVMETAPWDGYGRVRAADFSGIMGGLVHSDGETILWNSSSWNPMELRFLGEHSVYTVSTLFVIRLHSYDEASGRDTTPDGGAYVLRLGGLSLDNGDGTHNLKGGLYGLYISPDAMEAGFLKGTGLYGTSYLGVRMWDMAGTLYREALYSGQPSPYPVAAADLLKKDSETGAYVNLAIQPMTLGTDLGGLHGEFASSAEDSGRVVGYNGSGSTLSIKASPGWGLFSIGYELGNTYSNPEAQSSWSMTSAGTAGFGALGVLLRTLGSGCFRPPVVHGTTARWRAQCPVIS